jgi:hypothetical protein
MRFHRSAISLLVLATACIGPAALAERPPAPTTRPAATEQPSRSTSDVRNARYDVRDFAESPPSPAAAGLHLRLGVELDPIPIVPSLWCATPNVHGIRFAMIEVPAPEWASIQFDEVSQSPDLCASPALTNARGQAFVRFKPLVDGGGPVVLSDGSSQWAGFGGSGSVFGG